MYRLASAKARSRALGTVSIHDNLRIGAFRRRHNVSLEPEIESLLEIFPLRDKLSANGSELSGGQQQMVAIARGLMAQPTLLTLDEPSLGLSPLMVGEVTKLVRKVREERGISILMSEQHIGTAVALADRVYLLRNGQIVHEARRPQDLSREAVLASYLGATGVAVGGDGGTMQ